MHLVPKDPSQSAHSAMRRQDMDNMFHDYLNLLVPDEAHSTLNPSDLNVVFEYILCYFRVSHPYMVPNSPRYP